MIGRCVGVRLWESSKLVDRVVGVGFLSGQFEWNLNLVAMLVKESPQRGLRLWRAWLCIRTGSGSFDDLVWGVPVQGSPKSGLMVCWDFVFARDRLLFRYDGLLECVLPGSG